jgi:hypothetical protein
MLEAVKRRRVIIGLVFLSLATGLGWLVMRETRVHTFTLPDGSRMYLRGVTVGSNAAMNFGSALDRMLARTPGKAGARFRRNVWRDQLDGERLVFWFEFEQARGSNTMVDVQFIEAERSRTNRTMSWLPVQTLPNGRRIADCAFLNWPRDEKTLVVEVLLRENTKAGVTVGELTIKNPGYRP